MEMAVCHKLAYDEISYHKSGSDIHTPDRMLKSLSGDCQDHTVLLATLFKACGLDVRILRVGKETISHVLTEVKNPLKSIEEACSSLRRFYWNQYNLNAENISYEKWNQKYWFVADTAGDKNAGWSTHIGDVSSHKGDYITTSCASDWEWISLIDQIEV